MHLVLGATGGFGGAMVRALRARGLPVRAFVPVTEAARARFPDGVEVVEGDARRLTDLVPAAKGCESISHGLSLPWHQWDPGLLELTDNVVEASGLSGATIVFPGNLYGVKPVYDVPLPPDSAQLDMNDRPSKKGRVRNLIEDHLAQHAELRNIRTLVVRAGDTYGPGVDDPIVGPMFKNALAGKPIPWFGAPDTAHAFTYVDDVAAVATGLLLQDDRPKHDVVGVAGEVFVSASDWAVALAKAAGRPRLDVHAIPRWQIRVTALWNRDAREIAELLPHWDGPLLLDDTRVRRALPDWQPTPPDVALAATMAWYRDATRAAT